MKKKTIKRIFYKLLGQKISDQLRNFFNYKDFFYYDKKIASKVDSLLFENKKRNPNGHYDLELLIQLDKLFTKIDLSENYIIDNLLQSARDRYKFLQSSGINLKGSYVCDFGAGHGENLLVANEFNIKKAIGYDFSNDRFLNHQKNLNEIQKKTLEYKTLDLVNDDLGSNDSDIVMSFSAFEHFENPGNVLKKVYDKLKMGGYLYAEFAAFNSPYAIHRKKFSGVPHIQNIFSEKIAYEFFYKYLKINNEINRYTKVKIMDGNPFPEVNRWQIQDYEKIFLDKNKWRVINYTKVYNYKYHWLIKKFKEKFEYKSRDIKYVDYLKFILQKK
jgi:SAM-dependent methyltransferase